MAGAAANFGTYSNASGNPMGAGTQIIGGKVYQQYSPEWYDAMRQYNTDRSVAAGTAAGKGAAAFTSNALSGFPSIDGLISGAGGGSASGSVSTGAGGVGTGAGGPVSSVAGLELPDSSAANSAAFAKAKDAVGQQSRAALTSLNDELGANGMMGGGAQAQATKDIIASGAENLGQVSRDLATKNADTANDFAKTRYQGGITMRGQDIQSQEANAQLQLAREQAQQNALFRLLSLATQGLSNANSISYTGGGSNLY